LFEEPPNVVLGSSELSLPPAGLSPAPAAGGCGLRGRFTRLRYL